MGGSVRIFLVFFGGWHQSHFENTSLGALSPHGAPAIKASQSPKCAPDQSWKDNPALRGGEGDTSISTMNCKLNRRLFWDSKGAFSNPYCTWFIHSMMNQCVNSHTSIFCTQNSHHTLRLDFSGDSNFLFIWVYKKYFKWFALPDMIKYM